MIGIFDSGVGGLTVLKALREALPSADVLYFGDTKNVPYGQKSRRELAELSVAGLTLLHERGARNIVSACNSVSVSLAVSLFDTLSLSPAHLIEMVGPTVAYFKGSSARIVLAATVATVESDIYQSGFRMIGKDIETVALEGLASAIEHGASESDIEAIVREGFAGIALDESAVVVLACTHYPFALALFRKVLGDNVLICDPAYAVAERAEKLFWPQEVGSGSTRFIVSKDSRVFRDMAAEVVGAEPDIEVLE
jgi:glutamate racemase